MLVGSAQIVCRVSINFKNPQERHHFISHHQFSRYYTVHCTLYRTLTVFEKFHEQVLNKSWIRRQITNLQFRFELKLYSHVRFWHFLKIIKFILNLRNYNNQQALPHGFYWYIMIIHFVKSKNKYHTKTIAITLNVMAKKKCYF